MDESDENAELSIYSGVLSLMGFRYFYLGSQNGPLP